MIFAFARFLLRTPFASHLRKRTSRIRCGLARGFKRRGGIGILGKLIPISPEEKFLHSLLWQGKTVYDIGGNIGLFAMFFSRAVGPNGNVVLFEPVQGNCRRCNEHFEMNKITNVQIIPKGVGSAECTSEILYGSDTTSHASLDPSIGAAMVHGNGVARERVEVDTLDNLIRKHELPIPQFVKIDVEGYEYEVLRGMEGTIRSASPEIYIEIHGITRADKVQMAKRCADFLLDQNYSVLHVESGTRITHENHELASVGHIYATKVG